LQSTSFSENDAVMLAAFDVSVLQDANDCGKVTAGANSKNDHAIRSNVVAGCSIVVSSAGFEPNEVSTKGMLPEQYISCSKAISNDSSSCTHSAVKSFQLEKSPDTDIAHSHAQNSGDMPDCVTKKQHITCLEVESTTDCYMNADALLTVEAVKTPSAVSIQRKSAGRLSEKIKRTLQQNAKVDTPTRLSRLSAIIEKYDPHCTDFTDTGPCYGLPLKVKQLLETQRSITEFYSKLFPFYHL